ncbi:peptidoglycan-binding protein [Myxococcus sp. RHSTA-1-4]|uniref:peptidoglycan-binding protein n=1 Tax=Myxococcus sp. RHSTA-1-4 TaxID=2874601 RepID=UPI001CC03103|nr:peptidoglycan-binding protein [Myxococcus sp. RHSTA-1-4]MBZ4415047.1 peptidoglycan-binding protein [Myxococcus sp. RHSTA-1-4]
MPEQETYMPTPGRAPKADPILKEGSRGDAVKELQMLLARAGFSAGAADGIFGAMTKTAVMNFQRARGLTVDGIVGPATWAALRGAITPEPTPVSELRTKIIAEAQWGISNTSSIHYKQLRPMDGINQRRKLPLNTDCSGFVTLCYKWAGASDPNGLGYNGQGYTGTLLSYLSRISQSQVQAGDLVLWARNGKGEHVALVLEPGSDPMLVSHGEESGPYKVRFSSSNRYHSGADVYWLRLSSVDGVTREAPPEALRAPPPQVIGATDAPSEVGLSREAVPPPGKH